MRGGRSLSSQVFDQLGIPIKLEPKFFPSNELQAACCTIALRETQGDQPAIRLAHRVLKALWQEEKNSADPATLAGLMTDVGLDAEKVLKLGEEPRW